MTGAVVFSSAPVLVCGFESGGFGVIPGGSCLIPRPSLWVSWVWLWIRGVDGGFGGVGVVGLRFWGCGLGVCLRKCDELSH